MFSWFKEIQSSPTSQAPGPRYEGPVCSGSGSSIVFGPVTVDDRFDGPLQHVPLLTDLAKVLRQRLVDLARQPELAAELAALTPPFVPSAIDVKMNVGNFQLALCDDR